MCRNIFCAMGLVLGLACSGFCQPAGVYYVAAGNPSSFKDGLSWATAFDNLDDALAVAVSGDNVQVAAGTYVPSGVTFSVPANVTVKGGWCNYWESFGNVTDIGQYYNPKAYQAILSGDTNGDDKAVNLYGNPYALDAEPTRADNKAAIMTLAGNAALDGFIFYDGGKEVLGGTAGIGITNGTTVTINNCEFYGCTGAQTIGNATGDVTISNCHFQGNAASGGVIKGTGLTLTKCTFKGNSNSGMYSNGVYCEGDLIMSDCVTLDSISGADSAFGSLYLRSSNSCTFTISRCVFRNDAADGSSTFMYNIGSTAEQTYSFTNCLWAGCVSHTSNGTIQIYPRYAGASTTVNIFNCTVADNHGGAARTGATAGIDVVGGHNLLNTSFVLNLKNTILWGNSGADILWNTASLSFIDTTYNPFMISYCCMDTADPNNWDSYPLPWKDATNLVVSNPQFAGNGDYHLQSTSPCIDKGDPASSYVNEPKWLNGCRINMGAYGNTAEAEVTTCHAALTADATGDCKVGNPDLLTLRNQWNKSCPGFAP